MANAPRVPNGEQVAIDNSKQDIQVIAEFLKGKGNLDTIWRRFDRNDKGYIDDSELQDLIYCALCFFCTERDPDMPEPKRDQCEPFVKKIILDLRPQLQDDDDGVISRRDFEAFGEYLQSEYEKLQKELKKEENEAAKKL